MKKTKKTFKPIPSFKNEDEEIKFWDTHDATDYFDFDNPVKLDLSNLKPSTAKVTLRLPQMMLDDLKMMANMQDVPYQSLMKILLSQKIEEQYYSKYK
ncbi:MAG: hypothetical protein UR39_C0011G0027 [Candidatus Woesebacteria bacterium GW2011_GWA1_33_30]|uniref:Uncharacterized protein n=1 Tax=Candidatus Woesebacteria bacterium GW2011_GWA2_33_28 TaxID=1618561 RepID=A0A0G0C576_9BACT|nr:MAG: hypothetical protein UR38_C0011G0025 [Candidatus Woesebacteria bacterium GW2011_GWA2_33_28]KKP47075.1 MAG: hypothetical protein UR39_C0011G0027 [Candidatus Woesebacteria bacterium GW2011_GWA1_33_30]KKP48689.1 MAG: hypothetical protein UR40_C0012G0025 [Microgenomates group bacterium GW2011_GWC1_33_32]KKP51398.1 MAG: hypothetical protein UR44_C0011G0025 [Candidatus Woesebacteria bacterium GW2011_GWB1_33_38]KKP57437.1 MAG: hypothetical protein UR48_C0017G0010 [Microgenomates group bacteriu